MVAGIPLPLSPSIETGHARHVRSPNRFQERPLSSIGILLGGVGILAGSDSKKAHKPFYKNDLQLSLK